MDTGILIALIGLAGAVGSGIVTVIAQAVISWRRKKKETKNATSKRLEKLEHKADVSERDSVRLQLLILMSDYSEDTAEILKAAEHYFRDLNANWYMTTIFNNYLIEHNIGKPEWFNEGGDSKR